MAKMGLILGLRSVSRSTPKDPIDIAKRWVQEQLKPLTVTKWNADTLQSRTDSNIIVKGSVMTVITDQPSEIPRSHIFKVVMTKEYRIQHDQSTVEEYGWTFRH